MNLAHPSFVLLQTHCTMQTDAAFFSGGHSLLDTLKERFNAHTGRHKDIRWADVQKRLQSATDKLLVLHNMEETGGEPDVVGIDEDTGAYIFMDCSAETPAYRRNLCYDRLSQETRKGEGKPSGNAMDMATDIGVELLSERDYRALQKVGEFDGKTSSWVKTPPEIRTLGGALFCDRRYNTVFVYHNGASSFYSSRGFRGKVLV